MVARLARLAGEAAVWQPLWLLQIALLQPSENCL